MAMKRVGLSSRKPPQPTDDHALIAEWIARAVPGLQPILKAVDELVHDELSDLQYAIKWNKAFYGLPDRGWVLEVVGYDVSANVVFLGGADFDSPPPLGDSDRSRYVKLRSADEVQDLRAWIASAGRTDGWV